ncbi:MAG: T9SS type A sorting domain-containing protein [Rubricoccaceae bacterium]|nr:T9SS type A sorting domain-containing protein [Rubricoccaceae bacterium]
MPCRLVPVLLTLLLSFLAPPAAAQLAAASGGFDREPVFLWEEVFDTPDADQGGASDVVTDADGNVYVIGNLSSTTTSRNAALLSALSPAGDLLWEELEDTPADDYGLRLAYDGAGHLYTIAREDYYVLRIAKYTTGGQLIWERRLQDEGQSFNLLPHLALDGTHALYVTISTFRQGGDGDDAVTYKLDAAGTLLWEHAYGGPGRQAGNGIVITSDGGLVVVGSTHPDFDDSEAIVYRLTPEGVLAWEVSYDGSDERSGDWFEALGLDATGNVYAAGVLETAATGQDVHLVKLTPGGQEIWARTWDNPELPGAGPDGPHALAIAPDGSVYLTGETFYGYSGPRYLDVLVQKYTPDGTLVWWDTVDAPYYTRDVGREIVLDDAGQPIVAGHVKNMQGLNFTSLLVKYDADGRQLWSEIGDVQADDHAGFHLTRAPDGALYTAGLGVVDGGPIFQPAVRHYRDAVAPAVVAEPVDGPVVVGPEGGTFAFNVTVANPGDVPQTLDVWTAADGPLVRDPVLGPQRITLAPGASVQRTLRQPVPTTAPAGLYAYTVHAGDISTFSFNEASFPIEKQPPLADGVKLLAGDPTAFGEFGRALALDGDVAVIGAPRGDDYTGAAYVFRREGGVWRQEAELVGSGVGPGSWFGHGVAVRGDVAVVGAPQLNTDGPGYAYVFRYDGSAWTQEAQLTASDATNLHDFGVAVSTDGGRLLVGAPGADGTGAAYAFRSDGGTWVEEARLVGSGAVAYDVFGQTTVLEGDAALVGAPAVGTGRCGSAYVFRRVGAAWTEEAHLVPADCNAGSRDKNFGDALALDGDAVLVGAPAHDHGSAFETQRGAAYLFRRDAGVWSQTAYLTASDADNYDLFGYAVGLDGDVVLIGAYGDDDAGNEAGAAYLFDHDGSTWMQSRKLTASDTPTGADHFGYAAVLDSGTAFLGAPHNGEAAYKAGAVYVYAVASSVARVATADATIEALASFALSEARPNPSTTEARFTLEVPSAQGVRAEVFDALGRRVAVLHDGPMEAGARALVFDGTSLPAGVYVVRVTGEQFTAVRRVTLAR